VKTVKNLLNKNLAGKNFRTILKGLCKKDPEFIFSTLSKFIGFISKIIYRVDNSINIFVKFLSNT